MREAAHALQIVLIHGPLRQPKITLAQIASEIDCAISVNLAVRDLDFVQNRANLIGRQRRVIQISAESSKASSK